MGFVSSFYNAPGLGEDWQPADSQSTFQFLLVARKWGDEEQGDGPHTQGASLASEQTWREARQEVVCTVRYEDPWEIQQHVVFETSTREQNTAAKHVTNTVV